MKKILTFALVLVLSLSLLAGCTQSEDSKKIIVGASTTPHAEILKVAKEVLAAKGYEL
ncbi:MAG TPA: metal ABC transporter substrate-binding protein, partial [Clostridiales bacterium]|nr:metal ABC transporter substrate-binding protein [Clostridiales bacterium]